MWATGYDKLFCWSKYRAPNITALCPLFFVRLMILKPCLNNCASTQDILERYTGGVSLLCGAVFALGTSLICWYFLVLNPRGIIFCIISQQSIHNHAWLWSWFFHNTSNKLHKSYSIICACTYNLVTVLLLQFLFAFLLKKLLLSICNHYWGWEAPYIIWYLWSTMEGFKIYPKQCRKVDNQEWFYSG